MSQARKPTIKKILQQIQHPSIPKKKRKLNSNPFQDLPMMLDEQSQKQFKQKDKMDWQDQQQKEEPKWVQAQRQMHNKPLTVSISDHSKLNTYYSHRSIQKYIRYLIVNSCPNPMWLQIKRQSQVKGLFFADIEIENRLFNKMIGKIQSKTQKQEKLMQNNLDCQLPFLASLHIPDKQANFRKAPFIRERLWQYIFCYEQQLIKQDINSLPQRKKSEQLSLKLNHSLLKKYATYVLTSSQLKDNLYPVGNLPLYANYCKAKTLQNTENQNQEKLDNNQNLNNKILCIDCEMVITKQGFELARVTICNYAGQKLYDQFYKPENQIVSYNTQFSGITKETLELCTNSIEQHLHPKLQELITPQTILVGHSLENDLNAMKFIHRKVIDTSVLFRRKNGTKMKLKNLSLKVLQRKIQQQTHDSLQDCLATLDLLKTKVLSDMQDQAQGYTQNDMQYHFLKEVQNLPNEKRKIALFVDHQIDNLKKYTQFYFQKVKPQTTSLEKVNLIIDGYLNQKKTLNQLTQPSLFFVKMHKVEQMEWQQHYQMLEQAIQKVYNSLKPGTIMLLNFQINQNVRIVAQDLKVVTQRPYCIITPKN